MGLHNPPKLSPAKQSPPETQMSLQEKVFTKLLSDETTENQYCVDCGTKLHAGASFFDQIYVSINHGIFLCHNCASIHQAHYGVEISFVKSIIDKSETSSLY